MSDCWDWGEAVLVLGLVSCVTFCIGLAIGRGLETIDRAKHDAHSQYERGEFPENDSREKTKP